MITFLLTFIKIGLVIILLYLIFALINLFDMRNDFIDKIAVPFTILTFVDVILLIISVIILKII